MLSSKIFENIFPIWKAAVQRMKKAAGNKPDRRDEVPSCSFPQVTEMYKKRAAPDLVKDRAFLELLGRFELPTSSLPRMRSTC